MSIDELAEELYHLDNEIKERESELKANAKVVRLTPIITRSGKLKGELHHLTVKQYKKFTGATPPASIVTDGKIPWHLALDQLASERGYKSDEDLKEAIEKAQEDIDDIQRLKSKRRGVKSDIAELIQTGPKPKTVLLEGKAPVFPQDESVKKRATEIGNYEIVSRRNPSFWQVEVDKLDTEESPDYKFRLRYSHQAGQLENKAIKQAKDEAAKQHISRLKKKVGLYRVYTVKAKEKSGRGRRPKDISLKLSGAASGSIETSRSGRGHIKL